MKIKLFYSKFLNIVLLVLVALAFLVLYSFSTSPLYVNEGMDSCVFKTIGLGILNGKVPYIDIFDHKGPLLFYINAMGLLISRNYGILLLQVINLTMTLFFLFRIARLFVSRRLSMALVLLALLFYSGLISEGNQCEEWMLSPIVISLYWGLRMIQEGQPLSVVKSLLFGVFFGILFFIRSNDAVSTVGALFFGISLWKLVRKEIQQFVIGSLMFLVGFLIVAFPFLVLYCSKGAFSDLMYGLFGFNMKYTSGIVSMFMGMFREKHTLMILSVASCAVLFTGDRRNTLFLYLPVFLFNCILSGNNCIMHYYIVTLPFFFGVLVSCFIEGKRALIFAMLCLFLVPTYSAIRSRNRNVMKCLFSDGNQLVEDYYNNTAILFEGIPEADRNSVWNYNLDYSFGRCYDRSPFSLLYHNGIVQCNKVVLWWHYGIDAELLRTESIVTHAPRWIVVNRDSSYLPDLEYIEQRYDLYGEREMICVYRIRE